MSDTTDKALDLADRWAQQIGQKLTDAAPGAQDVAIEAVKVRIGSEILGWVMLLVALAIVAFTLKFCMRKGSAAMRDPDRYPRNEETPWFIASGVLGFACFFLLLGTLISLPKREIVGLFAPRGYVALMVLDAVSSKK